MYKLVKPLIVDMPVSVVFNIETQSYIPFDEANTDYQEYLKWLEEGNTPQEAD